MTPYLPAVGDELATDIATIATPSLWFITIAAVIALLIFDFIVTRKPHEVSFKEAKRAFETRYVECLLRRCRGNISRAARLARKDRKDFYDVIRRTGIEPAQFRS